DLGHHRHVVEQGGDVVEQGKQAGGHWRFRAKTGPDSGIRSVPLVPEIPMFRSMFLLLLAAGLLGCQGSDTPDAAAAPDAALAAERAELERLEAQVAASREAVAGFEVLHASYGHGPDPVTGQQVPTVKVALANGSPVAVARVSLLATFANEGQDGPWL